MTGCCAACLSRVVFLKGTCALTCRKDPASPYIGGRTLAWLKVKQPKYREQERGFYKP